MPFNWISEAEYQSALKAFTIAFDRVTLWYINRGVNLLVGTNGNYYPDYNQIKTYFDDQNIRSDLYDADIYTPEMILGRLRYGTEAIRNYTLDAPVNNDEFSLIEYSRESTQSPNTDVIKWLTNTGQ